ncbi:MAG: hypothetical protein JXA13_01750 [Anaerolineales bacterium]|nr:hypothetical protein [Anaerolineales bacterium]
MGASLSLYRLQQVDSQIDKIKARINEIQKILENDRELQRAQALVSSMKKENESAKMALRQCEANVQEQVSKIEQSEYNLYAGKIQNPKELQDLQSEAASLKKYLSTLEDRQLEAMVFAEEKETTYEESETRLKNIQEKILLQNKNLTIEKESLDKDLERLYSERQAAASILPEKLMEHYTQVREQKNGLAVAQVEDGCCSACGGTVNSAQQQAARSANQTTTCSTCKRFLYSG